MLAQDYFVLTAAGPARPASASATGAGMKPTGLKVHAFTATCYAQAGTPRWHACAMTSSASSTASVLGPHLRWNWRLQHQPSIGKEMFARRSSNSFSIGRLHAQRLHVASSDFGASQDHRYITKTRAEEFPEAGAIL